MTTFGNARTDLPKWVVIGALWIWFAILLATHYGANSPYSYASALVDVTAERISGFAVNVDAPSVVPVTQFFYDATDTRTAPAHNLKLPIHSFLTALVQSFVRSYALSNYIVNLLLLWLLSYAAVTMADSFKWPRAGTLIAALTCAAMPVYAHYIGQPMHYIAGVVTNFLVILGALSFERLGIRDPIRHGLLAAILLLGYDPYVFAAALVLWMLFRVRFPRNIDYLIYFVVMFTPVLLWRFFLALATTTLSSKIQQDFFVPVLQGWMAVVLEAHSQLLVPFLAGHIGWIVAWKMVLGMIYWPALCVCVAGLIVLRPQWRTPQWLLVALVVLFVAEQLGTAMFDWENNPRRAIPVLFAFSCAYFYVVAQKIGERWWRLGFLLTLIFCMFLTMADVVMRNPLIAFIHLGEAVRAPVKDAIGMSEWLIDPSIWPKLVLDQNRRWWDIETAKVARPMVFIASNTLLAGFLGAFLWVLRKAGLVPRLLPAAFGIAFLLSLAARFL